MKAVKSARSPKLRTPPVCAKARNPAKARKRETKARMKAGWLDPAGRAAKQEPKARRIVAQRLNERIVGVLRLIVELGDDGKMENVVFGREYEAGDRKRNGGAGQRENDDAKPIAENRALPLMPHRTLLSQLKKK